MYRNIKGFMVQTGDPTGERWAGPGRAGLVRSVLLGLDGTGVCVPHCTGTGKGGQSIWGGRFEDEFHDSLKVCVRSVPAQQVKRSIAVLCSTPGEG